MRKRELLFGLFIFATALLVRVVFITEYHSKIDLDIRQLDQTDNNTFSVWAQMIADGDILCREQVHAYHHWTERVAPASRWLTWYGNPLTYHQSPLYPYFISAVYRFLGNGHAIFGYVQALLGALTCLLTFVLAKRMISLTAGVSAGLLLAFSGPYFFYDAFLLRDGPLALLVVVLALALERAVTRGRTFDWFKVGAALGLFTLAKETGPALLVITVVLVLWQMRKVPRQAWRVVGVTLVGWVLLLSPVIARNVAVGAPAFKMSTRGPEVFVAGNALGQDGVHWNPPSRDMRSILVETDFSLSGAMAETLATHRANPMGYMELLWEKTKALVNVFEIPNNVNYYLFISHLESLRLGFVTLIILGPLAILGMLLALPRRKELAIPYILLLTLSASIISLYVIARFRLQIFPLLAFFAGYTVHWSVNAFKKAQISRLVLASLALIYLASFCDSEDHKPIEGTYKYTILMNKHLVTNNLVQAKVYRDLFERKAREVGKIPHDRSAVLKLAAVDRAFTHFRAADSLPPESIDRLVEMGIGYGELVAVTAKGMQSQLEGISRSYLVRAVAQEPNAKRVQYGLGLLEAALGNGGESLHHFANELRQNPGHVPTLLLVGRVLHEKGKDPEALAYLEQARRAGADDVSDLLIQALIMVDPRHREERIKLPDGTPIKTQNLALAEELGRQALVLSPDDPEVLKPCAHVFYSCGVLGDGKVLVDQAIDLLRRVQGELGGDTDAVRRRIEGFERTRKQRWSENTEEEG